MASVQRVSTKLIQPFFKRGRFSNPFPAYEGQSKSFNEKKDKESEGEYKKIIKKIIYRTFATPAVDVGKKTNKSTKASSASNS